MNRTTPPRSAKLSRSNPATTNQYVEAELAMKEWALARLHESEAKLRRYRAPD